MPERIGAYRLESPLGRGGMGEVFLAWDERLERPVAIKRIRHDAFVQGHQRERFRREARLAARLSHASIVQVHELVVEESGDAIVMEYVDGPTLAERLARGPLDVAEAIRLAKEIAEGLAAAHEAGLIHRDLKAENVVITPAGHAKILDFGLARPVCWDGEFLTQHGALVGTCYAMSPEQASGGDLDERSDLFSLGALLYEMLAGHSAFRAKDPRATLQRVLYEQPQPLTEVRPDLPLALVSLVERLLAKDCEDRPRNALSVVHKLEKIERELPEVEWTERNDDSVSDMPTQAFPMLPGSRSAATAPRSVSATERPLRRTRGWILFLGGALAALVISVVALYVHSGTQTVPGSPLRVVVYTDIPSHLGREGIISAALNGLGSLEGITPLDPVVVRSEASPQELARAVAAEEILAVRLDHNGDWGNVTLRRLKRDGTALRNGQPFLVYLGPDDLSTLASAIDSQIRSVYQDHLPRPGSPKLEVRDSDYKAFLSFRGKVNQGRSLDDADLVRLKEIIRNSPHFLEAQIFASEVYRSRFQATPNLADRALAIAYAQGAQKLSPADPRPVVSHFRIALEWNLAEAEKDLKRLEEMMIGDPQLLVYQATLAERQRDTAKALDCLQKAVKRVPSWRNLFDLAALEIRLGHVPDARQHLDNLLDVSPGNQWGMAKLAEVELIYGDIAKAEQLYLQLTHVERKRGYFTNLGLARSLLGNFPSAIEAYKEALDVAPDHPMVLLNLAEAELALGRKAEAKGHLRKTLKGIEERRKAAPLSAKDSMTQAQCLARLGQVREAVRITQGALRQGSEDAEALYMAALVYALADDHQIALVNAQAALDKGLRPEWFQLPIFPMREDPELKAMLQKAASSRSS
jgi:serine/threonine protein kinase/tetratricopeptide (TPR) repeat protein